jgi:hypothetical protein
VCTKKHFHCPLIAASGKGAEQDCGDKNVNQEEREKHHDTCISCDTFAGGADCTTPGATLANLKSKQGFWRATSTTAVFHACNPLDKGECKGAPIPSNGTIDAQCATGHTGPKCSACNTANGFVRKFGGTCATCAPGEGEALLLVAPITLGVLALIVYCISRKVSAQALRLYLEKRSIKSRILFGFVQVLTRMALSYDLQMPHAVAQFFRALSFLEVVDFTSWFSAVNCLHSSNFITKVYLQTGLALIVLLGFLLWYGAGSIFLMLDEDGNGSVSCKEVTRWLRSGCKKDSKPPTKSMVTCMNLVLLFTFLIYPSITSTLFFAFGCTEFEDGNSYLTVDMSINCTDPAYRKMRMWAAVMIPVFVLGIPAAYLRLLWRHRGALNPKPSTAAQRRDASLVGRDAWAHKQREHDPSIHHLSFLWGGYRPKLWWFEVFEMARKFLMTGMPILLNLAFGNSEYLTVAYGMLVTTLTTMVHALGDPYLNKVDALLLLPGQFEVFLSLVAGMIKKLSKGDSTDAGISGLILGTGVPIALMMTYSCIWPDHADKMLARGRRKVTVDLVRRMKKVTVDNIPPKLASAADNIDWGQVEHELATMVSGDTLADALDDPEAFLVGLLRAQLHARVAGNKACGVKSALLERADRQLAAKGGVETLEDALMVLQDLVSFDTIATSVAVAAAHLIAPKLNARLEALGIDSESRQAVADKFSAIDSDELEQAKQAAEQLLGDGPSWNVLQQLLGALGLDEEFQARALLGAVKQLLAKRLALPVPCRAPALDAVAKLEHAVDSTGGVTAVQERIEKVVDAALPLLSGHISEEAVIGVLSALCGEAVDREHLVQAAASVVARLARDIDDETTRRAQTNSKEAKPVTMAGVELALAAVAAGTFDTA